MEDFDDMSDEDLEKILHHAEQELNDGLFYTSLVDDNGKWIGDLQCNKCKRVAHFGDHPFPHKFECPMRRS